MNQRVRFEITASGVDPKTGDPFARTIFCECWAELYDLLPSKSETQALGAPIVPVNVRVRVRARKGFSAAMSIVELTGGQKRNLRIIGGPSFIEGGKRIEFLGEFNEKC